MSPQEKLFNKSYAPELLKIAEGDLVSAGILERSGAGRLENVGFLSQQAIEKAIKAVLCHLGIPIPLVHDLGALVGKLPPSQHPPSGYDLGLLTQFAMARRYEEGKWNLTQEEMRIVLKTADDVVKWAKKII